MNDSKLDQIKKLARDIEAGLVGNHASKSQWYGSIQKASEEQRKPNETREMAFSRFVTSDPDGRAMFKAMRGAAGSDFVPAPAPEPVAKDNPANLEIRKLADELMAADASLSRLDALVKVHNAHPALAAKAKAA